MTVVLRILPLLAAISCMACAPVVSTQPARRVSADTISVAAIGEAARATPPLPSTKPAVQLRFDELRTTLRDGCRRDAEAETNFAEKEAFAQANECLRERVAKARADLLITARPAAERRAQLMALEAEYDALISDVCGLSEEAIWLNFETGERDWGSLNGYVFMACEERASIDRAYFLKTMARGDVAGLSERILAVRETGERQHTVLGERREDVRALLGKPSPDPIQYGPAPLDELGKTELLTKMDKITRTNRRLATDTCTLFPKLAEAFGDVGACEAAVTTYYSSIARYDDSFAAPSDDDG